jgi:gentisate 1,2-dioxygenase
MVMSSSGFRHLVSRAPATIQAGRAQYLTKPPVAGAESSAQAHVFADQATRAFDPGAQTGLIELDRGEQMGVDYPATTANLLARYLVLREGDEFELEVQASSVLCYAMKGSGRSFQEDEVIEWTQGDVFLMPGGVTILNEAPNGDAVLFVVTDEPLLGALGCSTPPFDEAQVMSAHYTARTIAAQLEDIGARAGESATQANLGFASSQFEGRGCVAPAIGAGIATLEPGADQSPHCHDVDTISLGLECESVHALVEDVQIDWIANAAMLTPAGAVHSQHNRGEQRLFSFYVQDLGPRNVRTWEPRVSNKLELEGMEIPV